MDKMKRMEKEIKYDLDGMKLNEVIETLSGYLKDYGEEAFIDVGYYDDYGGIMIEVGLVYYIPMTLEEIDAEKKEKEKQKMKQLSYRKKQYETLKAEFEKGKDK